MGAVHRIISRHTATTFGVQLFTINKGSDETVPRFDGGFPFFEEVMELIDGSDAGDSSTLVVHNLIGDMGRDP